MKMKKAITTMAIGKYSRIIISLLVNVVLSRILTPDDYGVVAVVTVFTTFFTSLSDMGLSAAVIQIKELDDEDINAIYSFSVYYSAVLALIFIGLSWPISYFYGSRVYLNICLLLSISLLFDALNTVPNGILNRNKEFKKIAFRTVLVYVCSAVAAIALALRGWSYYSLVAQSIIYSVVTFVWNFFSTRPRFSLSIKKKSIRRISSYSSYQFAFNMLVYFSRNMDNLLTGKFFGSAELGYYNKAYTLMLYPINNITNVIAPVIHPVLSDYQTQKDKIYNSFLKITRLLFVVATVFSAICFLASHEIILIVFGNQWSESVSCFRALSVAIVFQMVNGTTGAIYQSIGNTKLLFINGIINSLITVLFIVLGIVIGGSISALAIFVSSAYAIQCCFSFWHLYHYGFKYPIKKLIIDLKKEIVFWVVATTSTIVFYTWLDTIEGLFLGLAVKALYILIVSSIYLIVSGELRELKNIAK